MDPLGPAPRQEDIDLLWNYGTIGCKRAFFFEGNCNDEMGVENGVPTGLTYDSTVRWHPGGTMLRDRCAVFDGLTGRVNIGSAADIDDLVELTASVWAYCKGLGGGDVGKILYKGANLRWELGFSSNGNVGLYAKIGYSVTSAESMKIFPLPKFQWTHIAITYSEAGDRKIHIWVNGTEVTGYSQQIASVGTRLADAAEVAYIGNSADGSRGYDGLMTLFLLHDVPLSATALKWLSQSLWPPPIGNDLQALCWERTAYIDPAKSSRGAVVFDLEGNRLSQYTLAKPVFDAAGASGCLKLITNRFGNPAYMTDAQIQEFVSLGWELISHSVTHANPLNLTEEQLRVELADSITAIEARWAQRVTKFGWPDAVPWAAYRNIALEYYDCALGAAQPADYYNVLGNVGNSDLANYSISAAKGLVDIAYAQNRLLSFEVEELDAPMVAKLTELLAYIKAKPVPILTLSQAFSLVEEIPARPLHGGFSIRALNLHGSLAKDMVQLKILPVGRYVIWFLVYTDGSRPTQANCVPYAGYDPSNQVTDISYIRVSDGIYLCSGEFTIPPPDPLAYIVGARFPALTSPVVPFVTYPNWLLWPV